MNLLRTALFLCSLVISVFGKDCNKADCNGPIRYYEHLRCKPIYAKPDDCCAVRYDCSHLDSRSIEKCYTNNQEYALGEILKDEDRWSICHSGCKCSKIANYYEARFWQCVSPECTGPQVRKGCYAEYSLKKCCDYEEVCPEDGSNLKCEIGEKLYELGEIFYPKLRPDLRCQCKDGFKGELTDKFCQRISCDVSTVYSEHNFYNIHKNCAPIFLTTDPWNEIPAYSCAKEFKCDTKNNKLTRTKVSAHTANSTDEMMCFLGNAKFYVGDVIMEMCSEHPEEVRTNCVCQIPPILTCTRESAIKHLPRDFHIKNIKFRRQRRTLFSDLL